MSVKLFGRVFTSESPVWMPVPINTFPGPSVAAFYFNDAIMPRGRSIMIFYKDRVTADRWKVRIKFISDTGVEVWDIHFPKYPDFSQFVRIKMYSEKKRIIILEDDEPVQKRLKIK